MQSSEKSFKTFDRSKIFYREWMSDRPTDKALVLFHGGHEHSGRFEDLVEKLGLEDTHIFAWDARSHGYSEGERGYASHFMDYVCDAQLFINHIESNYDITKSNMVLMGHSVGSVVIATYLYEYNAQVRGVVLGSPAFDVKLYAPFALPALKLWQKIMPRSFVNSYVKPHMLTHDEDEAKERSEDSLISPKIAVRVLTSLYDTIDRVVANAKFITVPTLILSAGEDYVVHREKQIEFFDNLGSKHKEIKIYEGLYHEIYHEKERAKVIERAKAFILKVFERPHQIESSTQEQNQALYQHLKTPLVKLEPKYYYYKMVQWMMNTIGARLSKGVKIGKTHGYDSGVMLDYVYANKAQGNLLIGKLIDRLYLNSVGWRGIRQRGEHLSTALKLLIERLGNQAHIIDIASGPGEYMQKLLLELDNPKVTALCKDLNAFALEEGSKKANERGLNTIEFKEGNAFDPASIAQTTQTPNIMVVSGLYELFSNNDMVLESLKGIYETLDDSGYLVYTNQPTHPQLEFISRALVNREGKLWSMRLRPQMEMNALVRSVGFEPEQMWIDDMGIFSVTIARKRR